jgi:hypothetical protein
MRDKLSNVLNNHGNVVGYVEAISTTLANFAESDPPAGLPAEVVEEVRGAARQYAEILRVAAQVLAEPAVIGATLAAAARALAAEAEGEPEIQLTSRKVAQA